MLRRFIIQNLCVCVLTLGVAGEGRAALGPESQELKIKREMTGLALASEASIEEILEYVRARRGGTDPLFPDEEKPQQLVLLDAKGKRWTAETDGGVVELTDAQGRTPQVFETKTEWFKDEGVDRMLLSLEALLASGAKPDYRYGGGHFHVRMRPYFVEHPIQMASFVNLALTYEPILVHLFMNERRVDNARPLSFTRMKNGQTLAQHLGRGLNEILQNPNQDCRARDPGLTRYFDAERIKGQSVQEGCLLAFMSRFGFETVGAREMAVNLQSWRGAVSPIKRHDSIELRLFNAPKSLREARLEERLIRGLADRAMRTGAQGILYVEKTDPAYDLDSYYRSYFPERREADWRAFLKETAVENASEYVEEYLDEAKWKARRLFR